MEAAEEMAKDRERQTNHPLLLSQFTPTAVECYPMPPVEQHASGDDRALKRSSSGSRRPSAGGVVNAMIGSRPTSGVIVNIYGDATTSGGAINENDRKSTDGENRTNQIL